MPKAYFQCQRCRRTASSDYKTRDGKPTLYCQCTGTRYEKRHMAAMTYRGDGLDGRNNLPHGLPPGWKDDARVEAKGESHETE